MFWSHRSLSHCHYPFQKKTSIKSIPHQLFSNNCPVTSIIHQYLNNINIHHTHTWLNSINHIKCIKIWLWTDRQTDRQTDNRPEITVLDYQCGKGIDLDVSMVHPCSIGILAKTSLFDGAAALRREEIKAKEYMREMLPQGTSPSVVPLVFEQFSRWDEKALEYLDDFSRLSRDEVVK